MSREPLIIVGLGNPGREYAETRHNLGWRVVEAFGEGHGLPFKEEKKFKARVAKGLINGVAVTLVLPTTYMNESGVAVQGVMNFYKLEPKNLVVCVDDVALAFGQMRLRSSGGTGGHNGLKNINRHLGTNEYLRLRLGIDQNETHRDLSDYVLDRFTAEEKELLISFEARAVRALEMLLAHTPEEVMNQINPKLEKNNATKAEEKPL